MSANRASTVAPQTGKSPSVNRPVSRQSRSISATPLRTTPNRPSCVAAPATAERDRRAASAELATQLVERMHSHPLFRSEYLPNGLRAITTKQFVSTMLFFMRSVVGNARGQKLPADINTDDIGKWLAQLRYPQSRSWLKTPNVPHAFHHLVELVNWLAAFIADDPSDPMPPSFRQAGNYNDAQQCFPSLAYLCEFHAEVRDMFQLWNHDGDDGDERIVDHKRRLVAEFVQHRMPQVPNALDHITVETANSRSEVEERSALAVDTSAEVELDRLTKRLSELDEQRHSDAFATLSRSQRTVQAELRLQQRQNQQLEEELQGCANVVRAQRLTITQRNEMLHTLQQRRDEVAARRAAVAHQTTVGFDRHMAHTALLKRQLTVTADVQRHVQTVGEVLQCDQLTEWTVDCRTDSEEFGQRLQDIVQRFERLRAASVEQLPALSEQSARLDNAQSELRTELEIMEIKLAKLRADGEQLSERRRELDTMYGLGRVDFAKMRTAVSTEVDILQKQAEESSEQLRTKQQMLVTLADESEQMLQYIESEGLKITAERQRDLERNHHLLGELDRKIEKALSDLQQIQ